MNTEQRNGIVRELIFALLAVVVSFNLLPETQVDAIGAAVVAVVLLIWGLISKPTDGGAFGSLVRKAIQATPPVLVQFSLIEPSQAVTLTGLGLAVVGTWSIKANASVPSQRKGFGK